MKVKTHEDLEVYQIAFKAAMDIFELSKSFPIEEKYSLIDQIRRSSRSVCANRWSDSPTQSVVGLATPICRSMEKKKI